MVKVFNIYSTSRQQSLSFWWREMMQNDEFKFRCGVHS